jgi:4-amino-4-deoxy-L-arabinose transferase-like glycosyltransferase
MLGGIVLFVSCQSGTGEDQVLEEMRLIVAAYYTYRLARTVQDKSAARCAVMLMAVLPVYFSLGLVMIPDAPLIACWAGRCFTCTVR